MIEYFKLSRELEKHHAIFYKMWELGEPIFNKNIPTACIKFNPLSYHFNPDFYSSLSNYERSFVIAHECMHVILNHGERLKEEHAYIRNVAMDIAIHEILFKKMGFDKTKFMDERLKGVCIREKICPKAKPNESSEYYYHYLLNNKVKFVNIFLINDHSNLKNNKILEKLAGQLSEGDLKSLGEIVKQENENAGKEHGNNSLIFKFKPKPKRKWESVIKEWVLSEQPVLKEQWVMPDKRLCSVPSEFILPSEYDQYEDKDEIDVFFFQDTSGSCYHLAERFFKAAQSLPKRFKVRMFGFDTEVYEVKEGKLMGFGGTSFQIIEDKIQKIIKSEKIPYPTVFLVTDGHGSIVKPQRPQLWYWFISEHGTDQYISQNSKKYYLKDYE